VPPVRRGHVRKIHLDLLSLDLAVTCKNANLVECVWYILLEETLLFQRGILKGKN
jgi:hypothetical protein